MSQVLALNETWVNAMMFKLACGFWFILGAVLGRQYTLLTHAWSEKTTEALGRSERARVVVKAKPTASSTTTRTASAAVEAMEIETNSGRTFMDDNEAESSFVQVDEMMEDAFEEDQAESEAVGVARETTTTFVAPATFESLEERQQTKQSMLVDVKSTEPHEPSTVDESDSSAAEDEESDSADTKDKLQFVADQVLEAEIEGKETEDEVARARAEADKIEWEKRRVELEKQAEIARKKKAALKKVHRMNIATEAFRKESEVKAKEADDLNNLRITAQQELKAEGLYNIAEFGDLAGLLLRLKTHEDGKNIETSYKKALLKFHPDRSAARGGNLNDLARCEETFKLLQACRKVWENMGKPMKSFTRDQPSVTRSWSRGGTPTTPTSSNQSARSGYDAYRAGQQAAQTAQQQKEAAATAEFVQRAKKEASEAEARMREEAARRTSELQKMQREKLARDSKAEEDRIEHLQKAREREELRKKLEDIKRANSSMATSFGVANNESPTGKGASPTQQVTSGTKIFINPKLSSSGMDSFDIPLRPRRRPLNSQKSVSSPQSREETLGRL